MAVSFDLTEFLAQQRADGQFDSIGSFTVAVQKASAKLAKFSLPYEEAWVVKLLQAAVGWRASALTLTQRRDTSCLCLRPSRRYGVPRGPEILHAFLSGDLGQPDPLSRFCLALKALGEQANFPFLLVIDQESEPQVTDSHFLGKRGKLCPEHRFPGGIALTVSHHKLGESWLKSVLQPGPRLRRSHAVMQELYNQAPYCPMALVHDGRPINNWEPNRLHKDHSVACRPLLTRALFALPKRQRPWIRPQDFPQAIWPQQQGRAIPILSSKDDECDILIRLWRGSTGTPLPASSLYWVVEGAVVRRESLGQHGELRLEVIADASELPLDLTGLSLTESVESVVAKRKILAAVSRELERVMPECLTQAPAARVDYQSVLRSLSST